MQSNGTGNLCFQMWYLCGIRATQFLDNMEKKDTQFGGTLDSGHNGYGIWECCSNQL